MNNQKPLMMSQQWRCHSVKQHKISKKKRANLKYNRTPTQIADDLCGFFMSIEKNKNDKKIFFTPVGKYANMFQ